MKEKIGIISDTHGLLRPEVLEILKDCKYILHAGDVNKNEILDVLRSMGNLYVVRGNNDKDWAENLRTSLSFTIGGVGSAGRYPKSRRRSSGGRHPAAPCRRSGAETGI